MNHKKVSHWKSGLRIGGLVSLLLGYFFGGILMLVVAEILGIIEENYE